MFKCGDKILYPLHGAGIVQKVEMHQVGDRELEYYVVALPAKNMTVKIPVGNSEKLN